MLTGIDRVELAYLTELPAFGMPVFGLARTPVGVILLPGSALPLISDWANGRDLPTGSDLIGRFGRKSHPTIAAAETILRRKAVARAPLFLAGVMLRRRLPENTVYLNVGHANLSDRLLRQIRVKAGFRLAVMLHDTIPLDHPEYARPDQVEIFRKRVNAISAHADVVIHTANATRILNEAQLAKFGRVPRGIVAPLGVRLANSDDSTLPDRFDPEHGFFVTLGTIEPRKNHALLLDVWDALAKREGPKPHLYILGNRGWADPALLRRLDQGAENVTFLSGLSDAAVSALVSRADALLFPSLAEGFGLPALEAQALGTQVICSDLPVFRELLGIDAIYLQPTDIYSWERTILDRFLHGRHDRKTIATNSLHKWSKHLRIVLTGF